MRLRKYRAWLEYEERMIEWDNLHLETFKDSDTGKVSLMLWVGDDEDNNFSSATGESCFKLMESVGCNATSGENREIYQGDMVEIWGAEPYSNNHVSTDYNWKLEGEIVYQDGCYWIEMDMHGRVIPIFDYVESDDMKMRIIGNVFEGYDREDVEQCD